MNDSVHNVDLSFEEKRDLLKNLLKLQAGSDTSGIPLSYNQQSLWFVYQLAPRSPAYNFLFAARVTSPLDLPALLRAYESLVQRHPALRTRFVVQDNKPVQIIEDTMSVKIPVTDASSWSEEEIVAACQRRADEPFNLEYGPAQRVELFRISATESVLLLVFHHIIADLWSMDILLHELAEAYQAEAAGKTASFAPLRAQFVDYVRWQLGSVHGPRGKKSWEFWKQQLTGELPVLNLPTDRARPVVQTYHGTSHTWPLELSCVQQLRELATNEGATPFIALLAVFEVLLYRYTGQNEFLVGTATAERTRPEWEQAVGYYLNQVALRATASGSQSFRAHLTQTRDRVYEALEHQDFPFGLLVQRLQPRRDPSRSPIFQVMFIWDKTRALGQPSARTAPTRTEPGLQLKPLLMEQRGAPFDLTLIIFETGDRLTASLRYNTDLFDHATIERLAEHYNMLLRRVVANPTLPLGDIDMLTPSERACILETWNRTARPGAEDVVPRIVERHAVNTPDAPALAFQEQTLSYRDLNGRANQLARYLQRLGVRRGQTVALSMSRCPEMVVAVLAAWKLGTPYVFLDPVYPVKRLVGMLGDARPAMLLVMEPMPGLDVPTVRLPEHESRIGMEADADLDLCIGPDDLAYIIYTSGSTGRPKGTLLGQRGLTNLVAAQRAVFQTKATDRVLQYASLSFDASVFEIVMALSAGACLVLGTQCTLLPGPELLGLLRKQAVTIATLPPSVPAILLPTELPALRTVIVAGEACPAEVVSTWSPGRRLFNAYGPTEATIWSTVVECVADGKAPSIGRPIANTRVYVLDADLQPVPVGVSGELYLAGPGIALGYLNQPALTAERFPANPFTTADGGVMYRTGDLVRWRPTGELDFLGRRDHQLKVRGYRVELEEIQEVLRRHAAVADAIVLAKSGQDGQAMLVAYLVPRVPDKFPLAEVRAALREHLPHYMIPAHVVVLEQLPLTFNGKVDRARLLEHVALAPSAQSIVEPRTPVEKLLAGIWAQVLRREAISIHDNFFELGGASIQTLEVVTLASQAGLNVAPEMLFRYQTVAELADACGVCRPPPTASVHHANGRNGKTNGAAKDRPTYLPLAVPPPRATGCGAVVESLGSYLPAREVTTEQILKDCRVKLAFPLQRLTGIRTRRMAGETEFSIDLAAKAVTDCLARSAYGPADIDLLVCCNISRYDGPNFRFTMEPTTAARLRAQFGFTNALAFDVANACAGTFTAIHLVDTLLRQGAIRRAMVVSGEYITHLTRAAQAEIESFMDSRLACLTLGDSGVAMILEQAPSAGVGFQEIDLYTLGKYHNFCVAKVPGTAVVPMMFTDPVKSAAVTITEAVKHCLEALKRHDWAPESLKWLIMHQTSTTTLDGAIREINRVAGKEVVQRASAVYHLGERGNTATNSHFLAVYENMAAGKIVAGDRVFFAVSGSGQVVGSALYVVDDLPARQRRTSPAAPTVSPTRGLQLFPCAKRVRIESIGLVQAADPAVPVETMALLRTAGESCLGGSSRRREEIDLVVHTGTYRSEFLSEPALAAIAAGELGINHDEERLTGTRTFAFDLANGAAGTLTGCFIASQLLCARRYAHALLLASEVENNRPGPLLGLKETASALILEEGATGFAMFGFQSFPEHLGCMEAVTAQANQKFGIDFRCDPRLDEIYQECIRVTIDAFLAKVGLTTAAIRWFLLPQRSATFVRDLAASLALPADSVVLAPDGACDYFTSSLAYSFDQVRAQVAPGDLILMVEAAAGIHVACALYQA